MIALLSFLLGREIDPAEPIDQVTRELAEAGGQLADRLAKIERRLDWLERRHHRMA